MPITNNIWKVMQNIQITMNSERMLKFLFMKKNDYYDRTRSSTENIHFYSGQYIFDLEMPYNVILQVTEILNDYIFEDDFCFNQPYIYHAHLLNTLLDIIKETEGRSTFLKNTMRRYLPCDYILFFLQKMDYFLQNDSNKNKLVLYLKKPLCHILLILYADQESLQNYQKQILENRSTEIFLNNEIRKIQLQLQASNFDPSAFSPVNVFMPQINIKSNSPVDYSPQNQNSYQRNSNTSDKNKYKAKNEGVEEYGKQIGDLELLYENRLYETLSRMLENNENDHSVWLVGYALPVINFIFEICQKVNSNKFVEQKNILQNLLPKYNIEERIKNNINFKTGNIEQILQETRKYVLKTDTQVRMQSSRFKQSNQLFMQRTSLGFEDDLEQYVSLPLQNILSNKGNNFNEDKYPKIFLLNMLIMDEIKEMIDLEKRSFIQAVQKIDKVLVDNNNKDEKQSRIFPRFTWFLKIAFNQYTLNKGWGEYRIMVDIMRMLVLLLDNPLDKEETEQLNKTQEFGIERQQFLENAIAKKREQYQDLFANHNLPKYLMEMLCNKEIEYKLHHQSIKLRRVIFSLLNALLLDGNRKVQNQIYLFFTQNTHSQVFFDMISDMIDQEIKQTLNVSIYDDIEKDLEGIEFVYRSKDKFMGITDILKTIQLLCEGHFTKNQNYIRQQTNSRNSINLIEKISELFDVVIRNHTEPDKLNIDIDSLLKANQILDTLIESIQGPVLDNQLELIQSKLLKSISDILLQQENIEIFKKEKNIKTKGKSKLSSHQKDKNIKMHDNKRQIQEKLIDNLSTLSRRFSEKVSEKFFKKNENWMISKLKNKCVQFLDSLLEGNQDSFILNKIMTEIPLQTLSENLGIVYGKLKESGIQTFSEQLMKLSYLDIEEIAEKKKDYQRERCGLILDTGFRIYHLLVLYHQENQKNHLKNFSSQKERGNQDDIQHQDYIVEGYDYFKKLTLHIEINIDSKFYVIYFPKLPACSIDFSQIINKYEENYDRVSTKSKTRDLLKQSSNIIIELQHEYEINYSENERLFNDEDEPDDENDLLKVTRQVYDKFFRTLIFIKKKIIKSSYAIQTYSFRLALFQNIVILLSFKSFHQFFTLQYGLASESTKDDFYDDQDSTPIKDLSFIGLNFNPVDFFVQFLSVIQIFQVVLNFFVFIALAFRDFPYFGKKINMEYANKDIADDNIVIKILKFLLAGQFKQSYLLYLKIKSFVIAKYPDLALIFCAIFSLLNPVVTAILLLDVFRRKPSLKNILKSLDIAKFQLLLTLILFIVLTYIFALLVYYFFWDNLTNECNSLWICFLYLFDKTFKDNAGYVSGFDGVFQDNWKIGILDLQQLLYTFIIVIIIGEIISGIIIDTLANLREDDAEKKHDMETICFICGQNRDYLDRKPGGWTQHVTQDHNPMHYIFFIMYLRFKKQTDLSGFESVIKQQVDKQEISWFPIMDFIAEQDGLEEKIIIEKKKQDLKTMEDQVHIDYKEQNEKSIKEKAITILEVLTKKIESLQQKLNQQEDSDSDDSDYY